MKTWNTPEIKELKLSGTQLSGDDTRYVDGYIYDADRNTNWKSFSGGTVNTEAPGADVIYHP
ncbi:MAG: hypothetical protein IJI01_00380 [Butyrivibrio sp.]|uniref:hypothetical protein n=1 Tax=Butyrivibrio sp. TaxID=28121 RepID=UPI0025C267E8|nr:hypothetical protein [Butyrivibrio sp.]MBQ6587114.1 hypothetical protein [Butyrivibrio sp.]